MLWDLSLGPLYDLCDAKNQRLVRGWLLAGAVWGVHMGTPCNTFSRARGGMTPSLRSPQFVAGLPNLAAKQQQQQVDVGNKLLSFSIGLLRIRRMGIAATLENPATSYLFSMVNMLQVTNMRGCSNVVTEFCMYGMPWRKSTRVVGFNIDLLPLGARRSIDKPRGLCARTMQPHTVLRGLDKGVFLTRIAQPYPRLFCKVLTNCFHECNSL